MRVLKIYGIHDPSSQLAIKQSPASFFHEASSYTTCLLTGEGDLYMVFKTESVFNAIL